MNTCQAALHCTRIKKCYCGFCSAAHHGPYGVLITFPISIEHSCSLMNHYYEEFGYDFCDREIAHEFNVALCLTTKELSEKWRKHLKIDK